MTRDLFEHDGGGWLQDPALLDRLVIEKLKAEADKVREEGWKWIAVATDFPYGHTAGLRRLHGRTVELTEEETATRNALESELDGLEQQYADAEDVPEAVDQRLGEIETALASFNDRPVAYDPAEIALAGAFVSVDREGMLRIERGYVRPEDELKTEPGQANGQESVEPDREPDGVRGATGDGPRGVITVGAAAAPAPETEAEEDDGIKPLSERLIVELTAHRTLALRDALANDPGAAFTAVLHALCLGAFYHTPSGSCLEITARSINFGTQAPGLADSASARAIEARHEQWAKQLPKTGDGLWDTLVAFDGTARRRCSPIAHRSASMPCTSRGTATHGGSRMPTRSHAQ